MSCITRLVGAVTIMSMLTGCSGYSRLSPADCGLESPTGETQSTTLEAGQEIRVYLNSGEVIKGELKSIDSDEITMWSKDHYRRTIELSEVSEIHRKGFLLIPTVLIVPFLVYGSDLACAHLLSDHSSSFGNDYD